MLRVLWVMILSTVLTACSENEALMRGTLEWNRITVPATTSEPILEMAVTEGENVKEGQLLVQLDPGHGKARLSASQSEVDLAQQALNEALAGPRQENIAEVRSTLDSITADAVYAESQVRRMQELFLKRYVSRADVDKAIATAKAAKAQVHAVQSSLELLQNGTRSEQINQARARLNAAKAQQESVLIDFARLSVRAPRDGRIDSLPYRQGDQPALGAPLAVILVGNAPIARIYVPEPMRTKVQPGSTVNVHIEGLERVFLGKVRSVRSESSFTPYYALNGKDAARLSYLAEITLGADAAEMPPGVPLTVTLKAQ